MAANKKSCSFDVELSRAYKDSSGKMHVVGEASDNLIDRTKDRMSKRAIGSMADQCTENDLPLLDNHRATFGFGHTFEGKAVNDGKTTKLEVDFELDERYPQAHVLYEEVEAGDCQKQLSIGGFLNLKNPKAIRFERKGKTRTRVIDDIRLEHIASTRPGHAAVPRTKFTTAIVKDIFGDDEDLPLEWQEKALEDGEGQARQDEIRSGDLETGGGGGGNGGVAATVKSSEPKKAPVDPKDLTLSEFFKIHMDQGKDLREELSNYLEDNGGTMSGTTDDKTSATAVEDQETNKAEEQGGEVTKETSTEEETKEETKPESVELTPEIKKGLEGIAKLAKVFQGDSEETQEETLPEEIDTLSKAADAVAKLELTEKALPEVQRVVEALSRLLATEGSEEEKEEKTETPPVLTKEDVQEIITKSLEGLETKTDHEPVIKAFEGAFTALSEGIVKGLTEMGEGFKEIVSKQSEALEAKMVSLDKAASERLEQLEKGAGTVRQSTPGQDPAVATGSDGAKDEEITKNGGSTDNTRKPDENNVWRGSFDSVRKRYLAQRR